MLHFIIAMIVIGVVVGAVIDHFAPLAAEFWFVTGPVAFIVWVATFANLNLQGDPWFVEALISTLAAGAVWLVLVPTVRLAVVLALGGGMVWGIHALGGFG